MAILNRFWNIRPKALIFAVLAAIGCFLGAIAGEVLLNATKLPPPPPPPTHAISLLIDTSGSMKGSKLQEVKSAAIQFVRRRHESNLANLSRDSIAVVAFSNTANMAAPLTNNLKALEQPINSLIAKGGTRVDLGIKAAADELSTKKQANRSILLFTDGQPDNPELALSAGKAAKNQGVRILAVATDDANKKLLTEITGDASLVFSTSAGSFEQAFQKAEKVIEDTNIISRDATPLNKPSLSYSLLRIGGWTALLSAGTGLPLIISQNIYLRRRILTGKQAILGTTGTILVGFTAGAAGQLLYALGLRIYALDITSKFLPWVILGMLLGGGMALFVPNLKLGRAMLGGGLGGAIGFLGFWLVGGVFGDITGRLLGAAILGFFIGLMIALLEELAREAWLIIHWGSKEESTIGLGAEPVVLGSSDKAHIHLSKKQGFPPIAATICLRKGKIEFDNKITGQQQILINGSKLQIGTLTIEVKAIK